jgi:hypothetical protein
MVRVFVLALLALGGLALVARALPSPAGAPRLLGGMDDTSDTLEGLARWDGAWEGTWRRYTPEGGVESATRVRREHTTLSETEQTLGIQEGIESASPVRRRGRITRRDGGLACQVWNPDGTVVEWQGHMSGLVIFWHRRDPRSGVEESLREEIVRTADGDLYSVDGWTISGDPQGGQLRRTLEGRYRRPAQDLE